MDINEALFMKHLWMVLMLQQFSCWLVSNYKLMAVVENNTRKPGTIQGSHFQGVRDNYVFWICLEGRLLVCIFRIYQKHRYLSKSKYRVWCSSPLCWLYTTVTSLTWDLLQCERRIRPVEFSYFVFSFSPLESTACLLKP